MISNYLNEEELSNLIDSINFELIEVDETKLGDTILDKRFLFLLLEIINGSRLEEGVSFSEIDQIINQLNIMIEGWEILNIRIESYYYKTINWLNSIKDTRGDGRLRKN